MDNGYSIADVAAMSRDNGFGGIGWLILLFLFMMGGGFGWGGNNAATAFATQADITSAIQAQTSALNQQGILTSSMNNNYETAQLLNQMGVNLMNQNNSNLINAIQGFNNLSGQITNQTNVLSSKLDNLGFSMERCCCDIKTLIKDNQIAELTRQLDKATTDSSNSAQSLFLLSQLGKFTPTSGGATAGA